MRKNDHIKLGKIDVSYQTRFKTSVKVRELKFLVRHVFSDEKRSFKSLSLVFCSDSFLLNINRTFLKHNYYTDIITFNYNGTEIEGEAYISLERVLDNAKEFKVSSELEIFRLVIHGILHLCGYEDTTFREQAKMRKLENFYLKSTKLLNECST